MPTNAKSKSPMPAPFDQLPFPLALLLMCIPFVGLLAAVTGGAEDGNILA